MTGWWREPTRGQWMAFSAAWLGWVLDAFDFTIYLLVLPLIAEEFDVSLTATAGSITLTLLLRLLGGYAAGAVADRWGRKLPLMISMVWFAVCDGAIAFAPSFFWVLVLRTLFGFGMGAEWTSGTTLHLHHWAVVLIQFATFGAKVVMLCWFQLMIRWTLPRFRADQLMNLGWKLLLPLALANVMVTALIKLLFMGGPDTP